jgi:Protein of unknown function (DUF3011)
MSLHIRARPLLPAIAVSLLAAAGQVTAQGTLVTCESINYQDQECRVPPGPVSLVRQLSTPPGDCIQGQTWGFDPRRGTIWVSGGCRAEFSVGGAFRPPPGPDPGTIRICESRNYQNTECAVPGGPVALVRQLSTPPGDCIEGRTWGFDPNRSTIWVSSGCRAEFSVGGAFRPPPPGPPPGTIVSCESTNYQYSECRVPRGFVSLVRQLSTPPGDCIEGRTWGSDPRQGTIWVSSGCRAEFSIAPR